LRAKSNTDVVTDEDGSGNGVYVFAGGKVEVLDELAELS